MEQIQPTPSSYANNSRSTSATAHVSKWPRLSIHVPRVKPVAEKIIMSYNHRPLSPGGHRLQNPARASDNTLTDHGYYQSRHNSYASPRTSTGVIPISTQTFINVPPPSSARSAQQYDSYSGRPRRSSLVDTARSSTSGPSSSSTILPSRSRPTVIQQDVGRPTSPTRAIPRDKDYYVTPASSHEPRVSTTTHKKVYSVDGDGSARLVADVNISATGAGEKHQRRKDSMERGGYSSRTSTVDRERGRRGYHTNASHNRPLDKSIEDEDAYSYTDPASMYRDTEPRWREVRPRRGSVDRGGATSRERPVSMIIDPSFGQRQEAKAMGGPPPSTRGWDKIQDNLGRTSSVRDASRTVAQSPTRGRTYPDYGDSSDVYYVAPRTNSTDRRATIHNYDSTYDYERDVREPRRERKQSVSRNDGHRADQSVERRGFGINPNLRSDSQTRYSRSDQAAYGRGDGRGSDESFERADRSQYRDSGYVEQHRRAPAAETQHNYHHHQHHDSARMEQEKRDREYTQRLQSEERDRLRERELREGPVPPPKRRDDYERDHERPRDREYDRDRERERERARQMEPPSERDKDRHHQRRDTDRDRDYNRKDAKGDSPRQSGETTSKPGISQVATGGLAGAAAAFGLTGLLNKVTEKREKDRGESKDREATRDRERERERERERDRERRERREDDRERRDDRDRKDARAASDEQQHERDRERDRAYKDSDRGLGFAFEGQPPEPPKSAPPHNPEWQQDRSFDRHDKGSYSTADSSFEKPREGPSEHPQDRPLDRSQDNVQGPPDRPASRQGYGPSERTAQRDSDTEGKPLPPSTTATTPGPAIDAEEEYRRRREQVQRELGIMPPTEDPRATESDPDRERRRAERVKRLQGRDSRNSGSSAPYPNFSSSTNTVLPLTGTQRSSPREDKSSVAGTAVTSSTMPELHRKPSILDRPMISDEPVQIIDNSLSDRRENRVRIVDPPTEPEDRKPKGILKKPTEKFPEDSHAIREGVAPLKDATKKGIPPGARWTKIDRRLVNPEALEASHERFEERLDCVIVLRVLTKDEIQKLADKTRDIRDKRYEEERSERSDRSDRKSERRSHRNRDRRDRDEYEHSDSEDEYKEKKPKMLEAPTTAGASNDADFIRDNQRRHDRDRDAESGYVSGGPGVRDDRRHEESRSRY